MITDDELDEIERRANAATNPWFAWFGAAEPLDGVGSPTFDVSTNDSGNDPGYAAGFFYSEADREFAVHARQDIPRLIREIRYLKGDLDL